MEFKKLGDIIIIEKGKKPSITDEPDENAVRVLQIDDLRNDNDIKFTNDKSGVLASEHDVLIAWDGANAGTIGYGKKGYIGSTIALLRITEIENFTPNYVAIFLKSQFDYLRKKTTGATIPHIERKSLLNLRIPFLPVDDQIRISKILNKIDNLVAQRRNSIKLLEELLNCTFIKMFGDPVRNNLEQPVLTLEKVAKNEKNSIVDGPFGSSIKQEDYVEKGIPIIRINNIRFDGYFDDEYKYITVEKYNELNRSKVEFRDILIARVGNTIGKSCIFNNNFKALLSTTGVAKISIDEKVANIDFIAQQIKLPQYLKYINSFIEGAGQPYLNLKKIKNFKVIIPDLTRQNQFAVYVEQIDTLRAYFKKSLIELNNLYGSLCQKAFKGELDLSEMDVTEELKLHEVRARLLQQGIEDKTVEVKQVKSNTNPASLLKQIVNKRFRDLEFTFEELFNVAIDNQEEQLEYEELKKMVFKALSNQSDIKLEQKFDVNKKRMIFSETK